MSSTAKSEKCSQVNRPYVYKKTVIILLSLSGGMVYAADLGSVATSVEVRILSKAGI